MKYIVIIAFALASLANGNELPKNVLQGLAKCSSDGGVTGVVNCLASRVLRSLEKADSQAKIEVLPGIVFMRDEPINRDARSFSEEVLPSNPEEKSSKLLDLILNATGRLVSGRTLKLKIPEEAPKTVIKYVEEGRGKMKKMMNPFMLGLGATMVTMVPLLMSGLGFLALKAVVVGKLAFVVALVLFVQSFFGGRNFIPGYSYGYGTNYGGSYGTNYLGSTYGVPSSAYPYARSIDIAENNDSPK